MPQASQQDFVNKAAYQYENTLFQHSQFKVNYLTKLQELLKSLEQKANGIRQSQFSANTNNQIHQQPPLLSHPQQPNFSGPPANPISVNNNNSNITINDGANFVSNSASITPSNNGPSSNINFGTSTNSVNEELKRQIQRKVMSSPIPPQIIASIPGFPEGISQWSQINDFKAKNLLKPEHIAATKMAFEKTFIYYLRIYEHQKKQMIQRQQTQRQQINISGPGDINTTNNNDLKNNNNSNNNNNNNPNQHMARNQLNKHIPQNINQLPPQMQQKPQNQTINWNSSSIHTRPSVNQPNTSLENYAQVLNTHNIQQVNQAGQTDRPSQANRSSITNQSSQQNHSTVDSVNKTPSSFTQQDIMKLRELKAEADKKPIPLRDITSTLSQSDKEQITTLLKPIAVSFSRVDQSIFLFFQHTRNEKNSIRFFQLKAMFKQLWDGINKGKFMVTVPLAGKIRAEFGQYFSFVNRLGLQAQANRSQGGEAEALQNDPRGANNILQTQQSQNIRTQNKLSTSPGMQQQPAFSQNTVSPLQNQQHHQQNLPQNIQLQTQQVAQSRAQVYKTQSTQAQNSKQVEDSQSQAQSQTQLTQKFQNQQLQQAHQVQPIPSVQQRRQSAQPQAHKKAHPDALQETQEQKQQQGAFWAQKAPQAAQNDPKARENTQKATQPLKVIKNTQSQKNKQSPKIGQSQEKKIQQQPPQAQKDTGLTSKSNPDTSQIKNSTIAGVPTYGKPGIAADQIKLPTRKRKASAASTHSLGSSTASPEELRLNTNQSIKKGKVDESEAAKIKEIALKLQRKKEESKQNPLGYFISSLGEALSIPPEKIEQAKKIGEVEKADDLTTSPEETGWEASTVPALTLKNAFQSIDVVKTAPRSVPQASVKKLDLNDVENKDVSNPIGGNKMVRALLGEDLLNINAWSYDELVSVLCVDERAMKRDYWTLKC